MTLFREVFRALPPLMRFFLLSISGIFVLVCYGLIFQADSEESFLVLLLLFVVTSFMLLGIWTLGRVFYSYPEETEQEGNTKSPR